MVKSGNATNAYELITLWGHLCATTFKQNYSAYNKATCEFWSIIGADLLCSGILDRKGKYIRGIRKPLCKQT